MRTVPAAITTARQSASSRLCKIWRIERTDGTVYRFTEHDRDLEVGGETYLATASFDPSSIKATSDLSVDDMDVQGAFDSEHITEADLLAGRFNGATFVVSEVLWDNTAAGADVLRWGWIGTVKEVGGRFAAELLGPTYKLQMPIGELYQAGCRAALGDSRCQVNLASHTQTGTVTVVTSRRVFEASGLSIPTGQEADYFSLGRVNWLTGDNTGIEMEVRSYGASTVDLFLSMPFDITVGDTFEIVAGCNKSLGACRYKFDNVLNFRGEPHAPVTDDVISGPNGDEKKLSEIDFGNGLTEPLPTDGSDSGP